MPHTKQFAKTNEPAGPSLAAIGLNVPSHASE